MRKQKTFTCILLSVLLFCAGCSSSTKSSDHADTSSADEFTQKYILTRFYGSESDRDEWIKEKEDEDVQHSIAYDQTSDSITVTASLTQAQYWVKKAEDEIEQNALAISKDDNYSISVNATDTQMTITSSSGWNLKHLQKTVDEDLLAMEIHQVFSGISSWHIDVDVVNEETGEKVKSFSLPDDDLVLNDSIWQS